MKVAIILLISFRLLPGVLAQGVLNRMILPSLNRCGVCRKERLDHAGADHEFSRDASRPQWHGWHAFRRGLGTNLAELGVDPHCALSVRQLPRHARRA